MDNSLPDSLVHFKPAKIIKNNNYLMNVTILDDSERRSIENVSPTMTNRFTVLRKQRTLSKDVRID